MHDSSERDDEMWANVISFLTGRCMNTVVTRRQAAAWRPGLRARQSRRRPTRRRRSHARCGSRGAWRRRARWTRQTWCARSAASSTPTTATTSSASGSCCCVFTATRAPTRLSSGRWRSASCRGSRSTASDSNASPARPSALRTSRRR